jgi:hypothetical protein
MRIGITLTTLLCKWTLLFGPHFVSSPSFALNQEANWIKSLPASLLKRVEEERFVFVRVDDQPVAPAAPEGKRTLEIGGLMHVGASQAASYSYLINFENLKKISTVIKTANYDPKTQVLLFVCEAFKYRATMSIKMQFAEGNDKVLKFKVIGGTMEGYEGQFVVRSEPKMHSKIEFDSRFDYLKLPVPRMFIEFGFGVIFQKIAERIRIGIEEEKQKKIDFK